MGGVHSVAAEKSNHIQNLLALCRTCHDETEHAETWDLTEAIGWRVPKYVTEPRLVPALLHTANGYGWWQLTEDAGYLWIDPEGPPEIPEVIWCPQTPDPMRSLQLAGSPQSVLAVDLRISFAKPLA